MKKKPAGFWFGAGLVCFVALIAFVGPFFLSEKLSSFDLSQRIHGPGPGHWFGFDEEGRDLLTLLVYGARVSLGVSLLTVFFCMLVGTLAGLIAGYFGGKLESLFIFVTDIILSFPSILLIIALAAFLREGSLFSLIVILSAVGWVGYARVVRGQVLSLKERDFVKAATGMGAGTFRIWRQHLFPNLLAPLMIQATFGMAGVILAESTLSFLGLGVSNLPSWGRLMDQGVQYLLVAPHLALFPGLAIAGLIMGFHFLGDGLRDYLDVK